MPLHAYQAEGALEMQPGAGDKLDQWAYGKKFRAMAQQAVKPGEREGMIHRFLRRRHLLLPMRPMMRDPEFSPALAIRRSELAARERDLEVLGHTRVGHGPGVGGS